MNWQSLRILLLPFSLIYGCIVAIRNKCYDWGFFSSKKINQPSICVGNITVGGTGKSPLTIYLTELLSLRNPIILSRGYGRKTKGFRLATHQDSASTIGDEPFMYWKRFNGKVPVLVAEKRQLGIDFIHSNFPNSTIILDDAFQHRSVQAGLNIVLMTFDRPVFNDFPFPAGNLRENRSGINRADIVMVTKCPTTISQQYKSSFQRKIPLPANNIFFSNIVYGEKTPLFSHTWKEPEIVLVISGIANPTPLIEQLKEKYVVESLIFPDHHNFSTSDIHAIRQKVTTFAHRQYAIITTEKDAVRFQSMPNIKELENLPFFVQHMEIRIDRQNDFNTLILNYVTRTNERSR